MLNCPQGSAWVKSCTICNRRKGSLRPQPRWWLRRHVGRVPCAWRCHACVDQTLSLRVLKAVGVLPILDSSSLLDALLLLTELGLGTELVNWMIFGHVPACGSPDGALRSSAPLTLLCFKAWRSPAESIAPKRPDHGQSVHGEPKFTLKSGLCTKVPNPGC